jgi:uncharacterized protein
MDRKPGNERQVPTRTCVGCGLRDESASMVRLVVAEGEVAFDALFTRGAGGARAAGRGAHLHARPECIAKAPRALARAFHREIRVDAAELGRRLVFTCDRSMTGLVLAARRIRALAIGGDAAIEALGEGAPLVIVAVDAGSIASTRELEHAACAGRAIAWKTKNELGGLLGVEAVALCAVRHAGIAEQLKVLRAAADAGAATREGAACSSRRPEAR